MTGTTELVAGEPLLRSAVATAGLRPRDRVRTRAAGRAGAEIRGDREVGQRPARARRMGIQPDLFAVFTRERQAAVGADRTRRSIAARSDAELAAVEKARAGSVVRAPHAAASTTCPYQVSALPVRGADERQSSAASLVGVKLQRYFDESPEQSDENAELRMRPTLMDGTNVLASAMPGDAERAGARAPARQASPGRGRRGRPRRDPAARTRSRLLRRGRSKATRAATPARSASCTSRAAAPHVVDPAEDLPWLEIGVGIALSLVIASLLAFWITRPIKQFVRQSRDLLEGGTDLTQRIEVSSSDETADLADNINQVFARAAPARQRRAGRRVPGRRVDRPRSARRRKQMLDGPARTRRSRSRARPRRSPSCRRRSSRSRPTPARRPRSPSSRTSRSTAAVDADAADPRRGRGGGRARCTSSARAASASATSSR